jgi:hypothetical protein
MTAAENSMLRKTFESEVEGVAGEWRELLNEELHDLYSSTKIIGVIEFRRTRRAGNVTRVREKRNAYWVLVLKPEGKKPR